MRQNTLKLFRDELEQQAQESDHVRSVIGCTGGMTRPTLSGHRCATEVTPRQGALFYPLANKISFTQSTKQRNLALRNRLVG
jgi:hypothetical protein